MTRKSQMQGKKSEQRKRIKPGATPQGSHENKYAHLKGQPRSDKREQQKAVAEEKRLESDRFLGKFADKPDQTPYQHNSLSRILQTPSGPNSSRIIMVDSSKIIQTPDNTELISENFTALRDKKNSEYSHILYDRKPSSEPKSLEFLT